jgi:lantibiotic modifying enzyme
MISAEALAHLAARASTLDERLAPGFVADHDQHQRIETRLSRWADLGAKGDRDRLRNSLEWRGINLDRLLPALGRLSLSSECEPPNWVLQFGELLDAALIEHRRGGEDAPEDHRTAVMARFVRAAKTELWQTIPAKVRARVTKSALAALERSLLARLTRLSGPVLDREYDFHARGDSRAGGSPETRARRFADRMLQPPLPNLFTEYPVLARLMTLACDNWRSASLELFRRLDGDCECVFEKFHECRDAGQLIDIEVGDADLHDGHREVLILVFDDGFRVVYKPRSLALDQAFSNLLHWLNQRGLSPHMRSPLVLCRDGYGWAEFIAHRLAQDPAELESFYQRMGVLACIAYVMCATDLHNGNLIAHGGYPVPIDLETLLHAHPRGHVLSALSGAPRSGYQGVASSVLESVLLPLLHRAPSGVFVDLSAVTAEAEKVGVSHAAHWLPVAQNLLRQTLQNQARTIEQGFVSAYKFIQHHRDDLLAQSGPLPAFAGCPVRIVLRDTAVYFHLLRQSIEPAVLRDAADREILLERLHHSIAVAKAPPSFVDMISREKAALSNLDVPRFMVTTDSTDLRDAAGVVALDMMRRTPLQEMRMRIEEMSDSDLRVQSENIRYSLSAYFGGKAESQRCAGTPESARELPDASMLIAAAERIGGELLEEARSGAMHPPSWRGAVFLNPAGGFTVGEAGASFADGGLGVAYFFAALFRVTGKRDWQGAATELSLSYLAPVTDLAAYRGHIAGGLSSGFGGLLYAAAHIAAMADSEEISRRAVAAARGLAQRAIDEERDMSLGDGLAGTLLGIASIQRLTGDASINDALQRGANRLGTSKPLAGPGLLLGRAGVLLVARAIGIRSQSELPGGDPFDAPLDWAEGSVGPAVVALKLAPDAAPPLEFFYRLGATPEASDDSFARGVAGEADALAWAAELTGRTTFRNLALRRIARAAERAYQGRPRLLRGMLGEGLRMPGLLHGSAGIGHVMLRLAAPGVLPALAPLNLPEPRKLT